MDNKELLALMTKGSKKEAKVESVEVKEEIPEPKETTEVEHSLAVEMKIVKSPLAILNEHELLVYIARQSVRTNTLLTQIRNLYINRPLDWKSPEEEGQNGEIS